MPTHGDYPWERDERRRAQETRPAPSAPPPGAPRRRARRKATLAERDARAGALLVVLLAVGAYARLTTPEQTPAAAPAPPPVRFVVPEPAQPSVKSTVRGRLERPGSTRHRVSWPVSQIDSRMPGPGVVEVWGRTPAPDGATVRVYLARSREGRRIRLSDAPVERGHFFVRAAIPERLSGERVWISARTR